MAIFLEAVELLPRVPLINMDVVADGKSKTLAIWMPCNATKQAGTRAVMLKRCDNFIVKTNLRLDERDSMESDFTQVSSRMLQMRTVPSTLEEACNK